MTKKQKQFIDDMIRSRNINFARIGMMVEVNENIGTIMGTNYSANLDVKFANCLKFGNGKSNCHPTSNIKYFNSDGKVIASYS